MRILILFFLLSAYSQVFAQAAKQFTHPLTLTENIGQVTDQYGNPRTDVQYTTGSGGVSAFISNTGIHYQFRKALPQPATFTKTPFLKKGKITPATYGMYRLDMELEGANTNPIVIAGSQQAYYENYYTDKAKGIARTYQSLTYKDIYPRIDWRLYIKNSKLEYDFIIHPGGNPGDIKIKYNGATDITVNDQQITIKTPLGKLTEGNIYAYEQATHKQIPISFNHLQNTIGFSLNTLTAYNLQRTTYVIDPTLVWGTYYEGNEENWGTAITLDPSANVYITGYTNSSSDIATTGAYQTTLPVGSDDAAVIAKFSNEGTLLWATYYGGSTTIGFGICCDRKGNVYVTGRTTDTIDIATLGCFQPAYGGGLYDGFFAKFNAAGQRLWGSYYGGNNADDGGGIVCDSACNIYIEGNTESSSGIATPGAFKEHNPYSINYGFLVKFDSSGSNRLWGTYYGGNYGASPASGLVIDETGNLYFSGYTNSTDSLATPGVWQAASNGYPDAFAAKFHSDGNIAWSTFYGGNGLDLSYSVAVDHLGNVFLCGYTLSDSGIASSGAYNEYYSAGGDGFLAKLDSTGNRQWGTYYAGYGLAWGVSCDQSGNIFLVGWTSNDTGVSTTSAYQVGLCGLISGFIADFSESGSLIWGSYYGCDSFTQIRSCTTDFEGNLYATGFTTSSTQIATPGTYETVNSSGNRETFIAKFGSFSDAIPVVSAGIKASLYPSPNTGTFTIDASLSNPYHDARITIENSAGQQVYSIGANVINGHIRQSISLQGVANGDYIMRLTSGNEVRTTKFSIIK